MAAVIAMKSCSCVNIPKPNTLPIHTCSAWANGCASGDAASPVPPTGVKAKVTLLDPAGEGGCQADVTPGVSAAAAPGARACCLRMLLLPAADMPACDADADTDADTAGVKGGGEGSADRLCLAATPAIVLRWGRSANGWLWGL